ncbi:MAG: RsmB/NOP family class I SAM-dependent RNA methyltransferase [Alphaproteobacteria bacterium]
MRPRPSPGARGLALDLLERTLERRRPLDEALDDSEIAPALQSRDRAFAHLLALTTLRRLGQIDAVLSAFLERPLPARRHAVRNLLRLGAAQLLFLDTPPHAAVDATVSLAGEIAAPAFASLANAVLRKVAREGKALVAAQDAARLDTPAWLWQSLVEAYGEATARDIANAHLAEPALDLSCKAESEAWAARLGGVLLPTGTIRLASRPPVEGLPGYAEGAWWVQDAAAALPARLLGPVAGRKVVEVGAAPGGKTAQLAAAGAEIIALDRSAKRLAVLRDNLARLRLDATLVEAGATNWHPEAPADAVLIDAPCSATGTIRRHPEAPHIRDLADAERLAATQDALIEAAVSWLKPGGVLVFATCSLLPLEGEARIEAALAKPLGLAREPIQASELSGLPEAVTPRGALRTLPCHLAAQGGMDGFFAARLRRFR